LDIHTSAHGTQRKFITPFHSEANGLVERFNRTVINMLSKFVNQYRTNRDAFLPQVTFAYNTTVQATTGFSLFEWIYGRVPNFPFDYPIPCKQPETWNHKLEKKNSKTSKEEY